MNRKFYFIIALATLVFSGMVAAIAQGAVSPIETVPITAPLSIQATTYITVTTTQDAGGMSEKCSDAGKTCTLRRAVNQARALPPASLPVRIGFNIPTSDSGYDAANQVWVIQLSSTQTSEPFIMRDFGTNGKIIVDGSTQPVGRAAGPRIVLRGDNNKGVFTLTGGNNVIRGLAFQGLGDRMVSVPGTSNNLIENNWFGLTTDGNEIYLRNLDDPERGSGEAGVYVQSGGVNNIVQNNVLAGLDQTAITLDGSNSFVLSNTVGTRADGTLPTVRWERLCRPNARYYNWFGGAGIQIFGNNNLAQNNRVAGMLYYSADPASTPEDAIAVTGRNHIIRNNIIGLDTAQQPFGVCGEGIYVGGAGGGHSIQVVTNTIVGSQGEAGIFVAGGEFGYDLNAVTVQGNVIKANRLEAFAFGKMLPSTLRLFNPAAVTAINGASVSGTSGKDSSCANCIIELFLDRVDTVTETLESLVKVNANASGNWTATLPRPLAITEGLRTASTTVVDGQIINPSGVYSAGTTTKISTIYTRTGAPAPVPPPAPTPAAPLPIPAVTYAAPPTPPSSYTTIITVTSAADPDDSASYTCYRDLSGPPAPAPDGKCTLRRAIVEATALMAETPAARPILIRFNIPTADPQHNAAGYWVIQLYDTNSSNALPTLGSTDINKSGQVVLDGSTQPDGRSSGPKIIVRGPLNKNPSGYGLVINGNGNVVRGLAFQKLRNHLGFNHDDNIIENNWFGLTDDGSGIYLRNTAQPQEGSGSGGLVFLDGSDHNLVQNNVLLGLSGAAIDLKGGNDNLITGNYVGARADGTIDAASVAPANICNPTAATNNWFGGGGVNVNGLRNRVTSNVFVGLLIQGGALQTPPNAVNVKMGQDNLIENNRMGRDAAGADVWICGRGVESSVNYTRIFSNVIVNSYRQAIFIMGTLTSANANQAQGNIISNTVAAMDFGDLVPDALRFFAPARVTAIDGVNVSGASDSPCPYCWVEVYLDDDDDVTEALVYLGATTANVNGAWSLTLPAPLEEGWGLRTLITTRNYGTIQNFEAGTSSKLSALFKGTQRKIYLPLVLRRP